MAAMTSIAKKLREARGLTQGQLGRMMDPPQLQQAIDRVEKSNNLSEDWIYRYSRALGVKPEYFLAQNGLPTVPIVGYVGASADERIVYVDDHEPGGGIDQVEAPPGAHEGLALEVRGNSMTPRFFEGDVIFFSRANGEDIKRCHYKDCVVRLRDGRTVLKRVEPGSKKGMLTLRSYNPATPLMIDSKIEWVAPVTWVRPRQY